VEERKPLVKSVLTVPAFSAWNFNTRHLLSSCAFNSNWRPCIKVGVVGGQDARQGGRAGSQYQIPC